LSSNQFEAFVASLVVMGAVVVVDVWPSDWESPPAAVDVAATPPFFLRRLICLPSSSPEDVKSEAEFAAGGGEAARFRIVDFDFVALFLLFF
jgi:hypothetical protein